MPLSSPMSKEILFLPRFAKQRKVVALGCKCGDDFTHINGDSAFAAVVWYA
jgi:hypothetical protein